MLFIEGIFTIFLVYVTISSFPAQDQSFGTDDKDGDVTFKIIKLLLDHNANVNQPVKKWYNDYTFYITPLYIAVQIAKNSSHLIERRTSLIKIIKLLLTYGADINFKDSEPHRLRRLPFSPLSIVEGDNELKDLLLNPAKPNNTGLSSLFNSILSTYIDLSDSEYLKVSHL